MQPQGPMTPIFRFGTLLIIASLSLWGAACDSSPLADGEMATVAFGIEANVVGMAAGKAKSAPPISVTGTNGTLTISDVRFLLDGFELDVANDDVAEDVEVGPLFVDVPLDAGVLELLETDVPLGSYTGIEVEIEALDLDESSDDYAADSVLAALVRSEFPDWPDEASVVVVGAFSPAGGGDARSFTIYIAADIEIELEFDPALEIAEAHVDKLVTLAMDPLAWLPALPDLVPDLSPFDYSTSGDVYPFVLDIENGFSVRHADRD